MNKFQVLSDNEEIIAASDAFFPFVDGVEELVNAGVTAIIQPYGSINDKKIIIQVVKGLTPPMPSFEMDEQSMADLLVYLHSLNG